MRAALAALVLLCVGPALLRAGPARADSWTATYDAYVAGADVVRLTAGFSFDPAGYKVEVHARTLGLVDVFVGSRQSTQVEGTWRGALPRPTEFRADGVWKGKRRITRIDFKDGLPTIRDLVPPELYREPIPPQRRQDTLDRISPLAYLAQRVARRGDCDAVTNTYDGRLLEEARSRTAGWEELASSGVSPFSGKALRCDIELRVIGGFTVDEDRAHAGRIRHAKVWLAVAKPGAPPLPVRFELDIGWLGSATVYLSDLNRINQ